MSNTVKREIYEGWAYLHIMSSVTEDYLWFVSTRNKKTLHTLYELK